MGVVDTPATRTVASIDERMHRGILDQAPTWSWNTLADANSIHVQQKVGAALCKKFSESLANISGAYTDEWCNPKAVGSAAHRRAVKFLAHVRSGNPLSDWWDNAQLFEVLERQEGIPLFLGLKCFDRPSHVPCVPNGVGHRSRKVLYGSG